MPLVMKDEEPINWLELPPDITSSIFLRLGVVEILVNAQRVCRSWRLVSKDPSLWRKIDMRNLGNRRIYEYDFGEMCRNAVNRSEGGLVEINTGNFSTDALLNYMADRSSNLKSLGLTKCFPITYKGLVNALVKLPLLEELEVTNLWSKLDLKAIGHSCPKLKTLKLNSPGYRLSLLNCPVYPGYRRYFFKCDDVDALAIADSMPELRHLQLRGNKLTSTGLNAILDNCPHLKHLDLRQCFNINLSGDLEKRCLEMVEELRLPNDSIYIPVDSDDDLANIFSDDFSDDDDDLDSGDDDEIDLDLSAWD